MEKIFNSQFFNGEIYNIIEAVSVLPIDLKSLIEHWKKHFKDNTKDLMMVCPVKYTKIAFVYKNIRYMITPHSLEITSKNYMWPDNVLESSMKDIAIDLVSMGAKSIHISSQVD